MTDAIVDIRAGSIGQAIVRRVTTGKHVLLADINWRMPTRRRRFSQRRLNVSTATVDVASRISVDALIEEATKLGQVFGVIHAAGASPS